MSETFFTPLYIDIAGLTHPGPGSPDCAPSIFAASLEALLGPYGAATRYPHAHTQGAL